MVRWTIVMLSTLAIMVTCCFAQAKKFVPERPVATDDGGEKDQANVNLMNYDVEKGFMIIEGMRQNAPDGQFYSPLTRTYEKCDTDCNNGTYMRGSCGMDCRAYYLNSRVEDLEAQTSTLEERVQILELKLDTQRTTDPVTIIVVAAITFGLIILIVSLGTGGLLWIRRDFHRELKHLDNRLIEKIEQQKVQRHPTSTPSQPEEDVDVGENDAFVNEAGA